RALLHAADDAPPARDDGLPRRPDGADPQAAHDRVRDGPDRDVLPGHWADRAGGACARARRARTSRRAPPAGRALRHRTARAALSMRSLAFVVVAAALGAGVSLVVTHPLATALDTHLLEDGSYDAFQFVWNVWWVRESLLTLHNPFFTRLLFYPGGVP